MQLVGIASLWPGFFAHLADRLRVEAAEVGGGRRIHPAPRHDGLRSAFFDRGVVQVRIRTSGEDVERERGGLGQVAGRDRDGAARERAEHSFEAVDVHRFVQAIVDRLAHQRMVGDFAVADKVFAARDLIRKDRAQKIFCCHALKLRRDLAAAAHAQQGERRHRIPAPPCAEHGRVEHGLHEQRTHRLRRQVTRHFIQREAVRRRQRQQHRVLGRRALQFDVELAAEAFTQCEPPGAVDAAAKGRMDDQLHASRLVEESFEHDVVRGRQAAQRRFGGGKVLGDLFGSGTVEREGVAQPGDRGVTAPAVDQRPDLFAQPRHRERQFIAAPGCFAEPERHGGRLALCVLDPHRPAFDAHDAVRHVTELEYIAGQALDREVFVDGPHHMRLRFEHHRVVGVVGDRAARGHCCKRRAALRAQQAAHGIAMEVRATPSDASFEALGQHADDL